MHGLFADKICEYIRQVSLHNASFGIWHLTDYIGQRFKNRACFFSLILYTLEFCFLQKVYLLFDDGSKEGQKSEEDTSSH